MAVEMDCVALPATAKGTSDSRAAGPTVDFFRERYAAAYKAEFAEFVNAISQDREPAVGFADGREAMVLAEAANTSVRTGRFVNVANR